jgi:dihydrofolate reductase
MTKVPKLVFSNTLREPLDWKNAQVLRGDLADAIRKLKSQHGDPIRSFGSIRLVKGLMELGLVDRLRLLVFPLVLGKTGREPIFAGYDRAKLELLETKTLDARDGLSGRRDSWSARSASCARCSESPRPLVRRASRRPCASPACATDAPGKRFTRRGER